MRNPAWSHFAACTMAVLLTALALTQSGCLLVAAAAGTGATVAYARGDTDVLLNSSPRRVADAAEVAMKDLELVVVSKVVSGVDAKVVGRTARDTRLTVDARAEAGDTSRLSIRAGTFGDDALQAQLLERIRRQLGGEVTAAPATQPTVADVK
jgi:hypothetical protein